MAAAAAVDSVKRIKAEATCSICLELLRNPVTTECGHSFCESCITRICKGREDATCPQCRQPLPEGRLKPNQELRSIVELFRSQAEEKPAAGNMCKTHQEPLKLYCNKDQVPICVVCMQSQAHRGHPVVPKEEAVQEYRGKMAEQLGVIKSSCGKLHQFVSEIWKHLPENEQDKERRNLAGVCEKLTVLQERMGTPRKRSEDPVSQPKESPSENNFSESDDSKETELEGHSGREPGSEPAAEKQEETRSHVSPVGEETPTPKPELLQGSLDDIINSIGGTRGDGEPKVVVKSLWRRFLEWLFPDLWKVSAGEQAGVSPAGQGAAQTESGGDTVEVTLDPATAHPRLVLSEDRKSVRRGDTKQDLPNTPERFDTCISVLGSEGFTSGRRYWEVEVGPRGGWAIGVARDSVQRKGGIQLKPHMGIWALIPSEKSPVPRKVGVYLDYEGGEVRFYNAENKAQISFHTARFTGRLVPFFSLWATGAHLSLSPCQR